MHHPMPDSTVLSEDLDQKQRMRRKIIRYAAFICLVLVSVSLSGCEPYMRLHVKNNYTFPIVVSQPYQDDEKKPATIVLGRVASGKAVTFSRGIQRLTDPLNLTFQDPSGKVIGHVEKAYNQGFSQSADQWEITAGP